MEEAIVIFRNYLQQTTPVTNAGFDKLLHYLKAKKISKGQFLLRAGEISRNSFFTAKGILRSYTIDKQGKEHIIQFSPEYWLTADRSSSFFNEPSFLYIDAIEDSEIVIIDNQFFDQLTIQCPDFSLSNTHSLHQHIKQIQDRVNLLLGATAEERYLDFIRLYPELLMRIPQWMIASYLGITPESLSRVRKDLYRK
ncbi:putative transcriptional regulator, Crp/Fnr family [Pseudopedobacter saltans DSM 12145]|uniref:Transcriptional regulator, Crp/Fnr family n=1 Tax=Pseudopedobacter saltans (strain ATCC 51119 / DSM 12145 / JCM 21818 / CCUG 39354 / LMG 10337 / NBRC 100064 / NCIMB 13643) TaxID=762903 RepID=F0SEZ2_PSESL|nr:Crp/Fnr family transcriptional regulator [Pseudopedobacter saltans]ADY54060.1 putative transcriptional regulator, Crp/Fnr family [Pseudopedobacter saltans DSM 12145]